VNILGFAKREPEAEDDDIEAARALSLIGRLRDENATLKQRNADLEAQLQHRVAELTAHITERDAHWRREVADLQHKLALRTQDVDYYRACFVEAERDRSDAVAANRYAIKALVEADEYARKRESEAERREEPHGREDAVDLDEAIRATVQLGATNRQQEQE
jgi:hypothetical protein